MNVLICTPCGPPPHTVHPATQACIDALGCASIVIETASSSNMNRLDDLCWKHNEARRLTLAGGYDALLHIDADMIVPIDTVDRLSRVPADVCYGLYVSRRDPWRWLCFTDRAMNMTLNERLPAAGEWQESYGAGMGCTLIHRHVLEQMYFRHNGHTGSDWWFAVDCANTGIRQMHDLGCVCGHIRHDGVAWPDPTAPDKFRIEQLW